MELTSDQGEKGKILIRVVVFLAMFLDFLGTLMLLPILPDILHRMNNEANGTVGYSFRDITPTEQSGYDAYELYGYVTNKTTTKETHDIYLSQVGNMAVVLNAKHVVEVITNLFVGFLVDNYGHKKPLLLGCLFNILSALAVGTVDNFGLLVLARAIQGIGGSFSTVAALALIHSSFTDQYERTKANAMAFTALGFGALTAPLFGTWLYFLFGRLVPFLILAVMHFIDGILRLLVKLPDEWVVL